jgi:predicted nucleic acid-binding Zn ribbon protein
MAEYQRRRYDRDGKHRADTGIKAVGNVLEAVFAKHKLTGGVRKARILEAWADVAGAALARSTRALIVRDGVMIIETQDAIAANFLTMQRGLYLELLQNKLGDKAPKDLRFQMGVFESRKPKAAKTTSRLSRSAIPPEERAKIEHMLEDATEFITPESRELITPVARKAFEGMVQARMERQAKGWKPCPICATLSEFPGPCPYCKNMMNNAFVRRASSDLIRNPDRALEPCEKLFTGATDDSLACAKFMALEYLNAQFEALVMLLVKPVTRGRKKNQPEPLDPNVPDARLQLELLSRNYLALKLAKPVLEVTNRDRNALPERVKHMLEATD